MIEIDRRLAEARGLCARGDWPRWLRAEFEWSESTARNFMGVYEMAQSKSANFADLEIPVSGLYLLAAPCTPEPVREEIIQRAEAGESFTHARVEAAANAAP